MRDLRDNALLRRLGYRAEATVYAGEADMPHGRHYVSAIDDTGSVVYAVRGKSGVPVLLVSEGAISHYQRAGHAWAGADIARMPRTDRLVSPRGSEVVFAFTLPDIRKHAPELLDVMFNPQDARRLLAKYDALRAARKGAR